MVILTAATVPGQQVLPCRFSRYSAWAACPPQAFAATVPGKLGALKNLAGAVPEKPGPLQP